VEVKNALEKIINKAERVEKIREAENIKIIKYKQKIINNFILII
jgi:hypothetical protein